MNILRKIEGTFIFIFMRIAVNARFLIKGKLEGVGWYTYEILRRMVAAHPEDEFILIHDRPLATEYKFADNVKTVKTWMPTRHPVLWYFWFEFSIPRILKREIADIFLSFDGHLSLAADTPTAYVLHDLAYLHYPNEIRSTALKFYKKYIPQYIKRADHIVSVSQHGKKDLRKHFPNIRDENISVVGNGCRSIFQPISAQDKKSILAKYTEGNPFLFYVGAVQPRKNISRMIQAMDIVVKNHPEARLLIVGRQAWKTNKIRDTWENSDCRDNIHFLGFVEDAEMAKLLASSEALVYPSLFEGFGVPVLEAMHCEVPVITSKGSSMEEVAGEAAILIDPTSIESLGNAMSQIINNRDLTDKLIEAGKKQREKYNWDLAAEKMYTVLKKIMNYE